jgi:RNA polymerase sigma-70 factor (ECF subfamily)
MVVDALVVNAGTDAFTDPDESTSDAQLVRQLIDGSHDALATLYDRHSEAVFGAALHASRDRWIADEVVQETFLVLWNRAELFDPTRGSLAAWLLAIARNRAIDGFRSASRHQRAATFSSFARSETEEGSIGEWLTASGDLIGGAGPEAVPEAALSDKEMRAALRDAIASLAPTERDVIVLAYEGGLSQSEISERLGWPIGTVKTRTRRALHRLRDRLERPLAAG